MICSQIISLLGVACHPLNEGGDIALIDTSFVFEDGDAVPVYVEKVGSHVRFFDDGETILHYLGRGVKIDTSVRTRFIRTIAAANDVKLNDMGELEIWATESEAPAAFSKYMSTLIGLAEWEKDQIGVSTDTSLFVSEVAQYLHAWKPDAHLTESPEYVGISGQKYKLDFIFNDEAVVAVTPHHAAVSSVIKKLLDIKSSPANAYMKVLAVIDDRHDHESARREGLIMDALATVWPMTKLEKQIGASKSLN